MISFTVRMEFDGGDREAVAEMLRALTVGSRAEPGCVRIHIYESTRGPLVYFIHSEWIDEAAFDAHAELPHTRRFVGAVVDLITNPLQAVRTKQID